MLDTRIILSGWWVALVLIYLYGDVLRICSGDFARMQTIQFTQAMWLGIAVLMLIPILMVPLSLVLPQPVNRWVEHHRRGFLLPVQSGRPADLSIGLRQIPVGGQPRLQRHDGVDGKELGVMPFEIARAVL